MSILQNSNAIEVGGYTINNSLRLRSSASAYLNRTPASAGNRKTWTLSFWIKRGGLSSFTGTYQDVLCVSTGTTNATNFQMSFQTNDTLQLDFYTYTPFVTTQVFRDPSAWYHIVLAFDTTQATSSNRMKLYVNGSQVTAGTFTYPTQNDDTAINSTNAHNFFRNPSVATKFFDGYLAETYLIDGQSLTPSSFGETDSTTGVWKPKAYTGTYGTNGFYLNFSNIALTSGSNTGLGKDFSGNANYWTTNNISVTSGTTYDAMIDSPTNASSGTQPVGNYCVINPLDKYASPTISNANLQIATTGFNDSARCTIAISSGKWYWEVTQTAAGGSGANRGMVGIQSINEALSNYIGQTSGGYSYAGSGNKYNNNSATAYGATWTTNDVIGVALDMDAGTLTFYKNNTSQGTAFTGLSGTFAAGMSDLGGGSSIYAVTLNTNFGQRPFAYTPPTGYKALCTTNLPTPTILQGNKYMDATLYTQNGAASNVIVNAGQFKPDLVWLKCRSTAGTWNAVVDSVRGGSKTVYTNATDAESTDNFINTFNSNGFTLNIGDSGTNSTSGRTQVGWQWQAGQGTTSSNTQGSITSTVSVSTTAGFSVVTYTGTGANATVGHGLGVAPAMIITRYRGVESWSVYHKALGGTKTLYLNLTNAANTTSLAWNNTDPTSTVFSLGSAGTTNTSGGSGMVAYCFAAIPGYSAFGSYTGNGSADGPMVYLNFAPKFILVKRTDSSTNGFWNVYDSARNGYNDDNDVLYPNSSSAEDNVQHIDLLSNGFKCRNATYPNTSGGTYIYAAFASNPFAGNNRAR